MKRRLVAVATAAVLLWTGCALVIDLGDEAELRPALTPLPDASGPAVDASVPDTSAPDTGSTYLCGLQRSPNPECTSCIETECCEDSKACAEDPACVEGLECIKDCMAQIACITTCLNPALEKVTTCSSRKCQACTPQQKCFELGDCCYATYPLDGPEKILRDVCRGVVLETNEDACAAYEPVVGARSNASPRCAKPPDAGQ